MIARILITAAAFLAASPALAQVNLQTVTNGAVLGACIQALDGTFDMNNAEDLDEMGLVPGDAANEARMRADLPGIEIAEAKFDNGSVFMGYIPGKSCGVHILGADRFATRDSLIHTLLATGVRATTSNSDGDEMIAFPFEGHPIYVFTTPEKNIMVQVR